MSSSRAEKSNVHQRARLEEEIRYMENRLTEIGFEGDCAYERAMIRFFQQEIDSRRAKIAGDETEWQEPRPSKIRPVQVMIPEQGR